jgi:hypothetical protein
MQQNAERFKISWKKSLTRTRTASGFIIWEIIIKIKLST